MRIVFLAFLIAGCGDPASAPDDGGPFNSDARDASSDGGPKTMPTPTVLRVHYPAANHTLTVRGSAGPLDWMRGATMVRDAADVYRYTTTAIVQATEWKPLLDDATWSRGPNYQVNPGDTVDVYPHFLVARGEVVTLIAAFHSQNLPSDRTVWAYLPPSYGENSSATYPVLYMHDGQNLFDPALAFGGVEWGVDETLDAAAEDGTIAETVVIGIGNTAQRIYEYTPTVGGMGGGGGDRYLALIADELKPAVDGMLRTRRDAASTAILGSSLGGLISAYAGVRRPAVFGRVGAMSPSTWWDNLVIVGDVAGTKGKAIRPLRVYLDSGDAGPSNDDVTDTNQLAATYLGVGFTDGGDFRHVVQPGGMHSETYWAQRLPGALRFLLGPR